MTSPPGAGSLPRFPTIQSNCVRVIFRPSPGNGSGANSGLSLLWYPDNIDILTKFGRRIRPNPASDTAPVQPTVSAVRSHSLPSMTRKSSRQRFSVLIVEDHTTFQEILAIAIEQFPDFTVIGRADNGRQGSRLIAELRPDVVVLDLVLPDIGGLEVLREAAKRGDRPRFLAFTGDDAPYLVSEALSLGVEGYVEKTVSLDEFMQALRNVAEGRNHYSPAAQRIMRKTMSANGTATAASELTDQEKVVLRLVAEGLSSKEIARKLGLSRFTVENHRSNIRRKTGLSSVPKLVIYAMRRGIIEVPLRA
jgi:DNA-binding NarL/FixJ family response regulator